jgi:hypothetical protein
VCFPDIDCQGIPEHRKVMMQVERCLFPELIYIRRLTHSIQTLKQQSSRPFLCSYLPRYRYCTALYRFAKKLSRKKCPDSRSTTPCQAQDFLSECDTLIFINHERVKPGRITNLYRIANILHKYIGEPFIAVYCPQ